MRKDSLSRDPVQHFLLQEWQQLSPDNNDRLLGISLGDDPTVRAVATSLNRTGRLEIIELLKGLQISAFQFVGSIQVGSLRITIQPKLIGSPLLNLLRYAYNLRKLDLYDPIKYGRAESNFQDLLIDQLAAEVMELLKRGLFRHYERLEEMLSSPRGRIEFSRIASRGGVHEDSLPCIHYMRLDDNLLNRVLLGGIYLGIQQTGDLELRTRLRLIAGILEQEITPKKITKDLLNKALYSTNRLTILYRPALTLINLLLLSEGISLDEKEPEIKLPGFLFDMNRFFQALVSRFLNENLLRYEIREEYSLRGVLRYDPESHHIGRQELIPRPDFAILEQGRVISFLDTKYRDLWEQKLPRDMLYQLALYAVSQKWPGCAVILYSTLHEEARDSCIEITHPVSGENLARVIIRPVNLKKLDRLISGRQTVYMQNEKFQFAQKLANSQVNR
jgi:5-methylcytosine-specific restriction enzyme subunit McrC